MSAFGTSMRRRSGIASLLALALVVSLLLAAIVGRAAAGSIDATDGPYRGTTAQGLAVSFGVSGRTVSNIKFTFFWSGCGRTTVRWAGVRAEMDESGSFSYDAGQGSFQGPVR